MANSKDFFSSLGAVGKMARIAMSQGPGRFDPVLFRKAIENRLRWVEQAHAKFEARQLIQKNQQAQQVMSLDGLNEGFRSIGEMLESDRDPEDVSSYIAATELVAQKKKEFEDAMRQARALKARV